MRIASFGLVASLLAAGLLYGSAAFSMGDAAPRTISVRVVDDGASYLSVAANPASPHRCFVTSTNGKIQLSFGAIASPCPTVGAGTGVNGRVGSQSASYAFHDLLLVTNKGTKPVLLWANATTTSGGTSNVTVAMAASASTMTTSSYAANATSPLTLAVGSSAYVGTRIETGSLAAGTPVTGSVVLAVRRV